MVLRCTGNRCATFECETNAVVGRQGRAATASGTTQASVVSVAVNQLEPTATPRVASLRISCSLVRSTRMAISAGSKQCERFSPSLKSSYLHTHCL